MITWLVQATGLSKIGLLVAAIVIGIPIMFGVYKLHIYLERRDAVSDDRMEAERNAIKKRYEDLKRKGEIRGNQEGLTDDQSAYCLAGYSDCCYPNSPRLRECPAGSAPAR